MFDGALSPWHVAIVVLLVFLVFGPKRIADQVHRAGEKVKRLAGDEGPTAGDADEDAGAPPPRRGFTYRLGRMTSRLFRRRRSRS